MTATLLEEAPASTRSSPATARGAEFRDITLDLVDESPLNPRKYFDKEAQAELTASVKEHGILTPLLARPTKGGRYELGAGHRRYRAAKAAGLLTVPVLVRHMTDLQLLEVLTIENLQREDVTALEEASGFQALIDSAKYDVARIADRVKKSEEYVYGRLKLLKLGDEAKKALESEKITPSHAILLARVEPEQQRQVLKSVLQYKDKDTPVSVRDLNHQIEHQVREKKRAEELAAALKQAAKDYPDERKIYLLSASYGVEHDGQLTRYQWQETKKDTEDRLVGVVAPEHYAAPNAKPKVVYFTKVKERQSAYSSGPTDAQWREREKRQKERERAKAAGGVAVRQAFAKGAKALDNRPFLAAVVETLMLRCYESSGVTDAFCEFIGAKPAGQGMHFRLSKAVRARIQGLSADELKASALFLIAQPHKGGSYDSEQYEVTLQLAKLLKIDVEGIAKKAGQEAEAAYKAKLQASAKAKLRKAPKAKVKKRASAGGRK